MHKTLTRKNRFERWFVRRALAGGLSFTWLISAKSIVRLSQVLADIGYYALGRNRRLAIQNLSLAYGKTKSPSEIREMAREVFRHGSRGAFELMLDYGRGHIRDACRRVKQTEGLEHLDRALEKGNGVVGLCAHLGNFILLGATLNSLGYGCATIMRQMRDEQLEEMFTEIRNKMGQITIPKFPLSRSVRDSLSWLARGNILAMYIDQRSKTGAIVDFMSLPTSTATGAAYFALRSGAPVLPIFVLRRDDGYYKLLIGPELEVLNTGNLKADMHTNTAHFAKVVEDYIRQYPTQWFWFDRRWKKYHKARGTTA
jgi:KDO2-lipid IV(A) lauroyltransferase